MSDTLLRNANALLGHGRQREALAYYERYLDANPQSPEAWFNRGAACAQLKRYVDAEHCYDRALALRPDSAQAWNARGNLLFEMGRYADAKGNYEQALARDRDFPYARGYLGLCKLWTCDWHELQAERDAIAAGLAQGKRVIQPFGSLMLCDRPADLAEAARIWMLGRRSGGTPGAPLWRGEAYRHDRLRIAYLSGDFHDHPVPQLMAGVFEEHDRAQFEIFGISFGPDDTGDMRLRLKQGFDHFVDAQSMSDAAIAQMLRENEIDIAIDLMGLTADARIGILQQRPAPVQVNYLGFPGTMSAPHMDYILADRTVLPEDEQRFYSETVAYLPDCYLANDARRAIAEPAPSRAALGLPAAGFVFASFNNTYKITPEMFSVWMRLLATVEGSVLWLAQPNETARANLGREAVLRGVAPERIVFAPRVTSHPDHIARLSRADLFLDTLPCNAHTTASDALWAGLPVLTCMGTTFPGRVAASLLSALALPELIARSLAEYEAAALRLAFEPFLLTALRSRLATNGKTSPLFDTVRFTRTLEAAYADMAARRAQGEPLASLDVRLDP